MNFGRKISDDIIADLQGRSGGGHFFDGCEEDVQQDIRDEWARLAGAGAGRAYMAGVADERGRWIAILDKLIEAAESEAPKVTRCGDMPDEEVTR